MKPILCVLVGFLCVACNGSSKCPACGPGLVCDEKSGTCVTGSTCTATSCGANATCDADGQCRCKLAWSDCDGDMGQEGGNGCECNNSCAGTICGQQACSPTTPKSCGQSTSYCMNGLCAPCGTTYNCDGIGECESSSPCGSSGCSAGTYNACGGTSQYCNNGTCTSCPTGTYNCDGTGECEGKTVCASTGCDKQCTDFSEQQCVMDPVKQRCQECLDNTHCRLNARSYGPTCDTSDLAGTGTNFCVCASAAECANSTVGKLCKAAAGANPRLTQCTCDTDADCPSTYPICEGSMFKICRKRCTGPTDCVRNGVQGSCDTGTGICTYPDF